MPEDVAVPQSDSSETIAIVHVVILTFNSAAIVSSSIEPLYSVAGIHLTVVDNDSTDGTADFVESRYPGVEVVRAGENGGFAKGVNLGAAQGSEPFLLLLNPDATIAAKDVLDLAIRMEAETSIGIGAPKIVKPGGALKALETGRFPTLWRVLTHYSGLSRLAKRLPLFEGLYLLESASPGTREVDWVTGAVMLIRRSVWDELGGLTTRWFMYAEDIDLCFRCKRLGYSVVFFPDYPATHLIGQSSSSPASKTNSAPFLNLYEFYTLNLARTPLSAPLWRAVVALGLLSRSIAFQMQSRRAHPAAGDELLIRSRRFRDYAKDVANSENR